MVIDASRVGVDSGRSSVYRFKTLSKRPVFCDPSIYNALIREKKFSSRNLILLTSIKCVIVKNFKSIKIADILHNNFLNFEFPCTCHKRISLLQYMQLNIRLFDVKLERLIVIATREVARIGMALYHCLLSVPTLFFASRTCPGSCRSPM